MSLVPNKTHYGGQPDQALFAPYTVTGGGGGGGQNLVVSTIVMEGSTDPLEITLPVSANDGFSVRQGGVNNAIAILTIDEGSAGQAEFGIRTLSTIGGNAVPIGRFELQADGQPTDQTRLTYTLDTVGAGNASTIGSITFNKGNLAGSFGGVSITSESGAGLVIGAGNGYNITTASVGTALNPRRATAAATNIYVPATGGPVNVTAFSTITGHAYELYIPQMRIQNQPVGVPSAGAWSDLSIDTTPAVTYLDTFDMASVSTIQNDLQISRGYTFVASGTGHALNATGFNGALSTAMTFGNGYVVLRDLGQVSNMSAATNAP